MSHQKKAINLQTGETLETQFERIYRENFDRVFFIAKYLIKSEELAEDVVSEVFISLWKTGDKIRAIKDIQAYLFIAVKNRAIRKLYEEPQKAGNHSLENTAQFVDKINPEEILLEKELSASLEEVVSTLPEQCQLIFRMAKNRQMKYQEIADEVGISISTVRTQLTKASSIVRQFLNDRYHESKGSLSGQGHLLAVTYLLLLSWRIDDPELLSIF